MNKEVNLYDLKELLNYSPPELEENRQIHYKAGHIHPLENSPKRLSSQSVKGDCLTNRKRYLISDSF